MIDFLKKLLSSKKEKAKASTTESRIDYTPKVTIPDQPKVTKQETKVEDSSKSTKSIVTEKKLEVKRFTETFKSSDPLDQIDQIVKFYNSFGVGKDFYLKQKTPVTAESPQLLLDQIYTTQELYIKHLNRLPFAEELRLSTWVDHPKKMKEVVDSMPKEYTQYSLALRALSMEMPLVIHADKAQKTI